MNSLIKALTAVAAITGVCWFLAEVTPLNNEADVLAFCTKYSDNAVLTTDQAKEYLAVHSHATKH